jgi:hypothetical protein
MTPKPTVVILGRPNVGKSTLFNRLVGKRLALVDDTPGVTRDRREGDGALFDLDFTIVDTAGLEEADAASLAGRMRAPASRRSIAISRSGCANTTRRWSSSPTRPRGAPPRRGSPKATNSVSASRCRSRPNMARGSPISTRRCSRTSTR